MSTWTKQKLSDFCDVRDGTHDSPKPAMTGFPLVTSKHIINNKINLSSAYLISDEDYQAVNKRSKVDKFDLLISMIGTVGEVALVKENPVFAIKNVGLIKTNDEALGKYLFYFLISPTGKNTLESLLTGSTQRFISLSKLRDYPVTMPPDLYRNKITSVLSAYDDLIENNEKRIKVLEEMAQLLYTEWFVNFNFPMHLCHPELVEGSSQNIGYKDAGGKMVDSGTEYGMIPEGWEVKKLGDVADVLFGFNFKSNLFNENRIGVQVVRIRDVLSGDTNTFTPEIIDKKYLIKKGDLLIGMDGIFHMGMWFTEGCFLNQRVVRIRSEKFSASFVFESIKKQLYFFQKTIQGATVGHLSNGNIRDFKILVPKNEDLPKYFHTITDLMITLKLWNQNLSKARDLVIPQLVTGRRELK